MIAGGREYLAVAWWLPVLPGAAILCLVLAVNLLGEGLRDALDPRLRLGSSYPGTSKAVPPPGSAPTPAAAPSPG